MSQHLRRLLRNPFVIFVPVVAVLWLGWSHYTAAARELNVATNTNILPGGSFDTFDRDVIPVGWQVVRNGNFGYTNTRAKGYAGGSAWSFRISDYQSGNASLQSPKVPLNQQTQYLYKGFYQATVPFDLLVRYFYRDGSSSLQYVRSYPSEPGQWSTDSFAFTSGKDITAVSFVYHVASNGSLQLDGTYLEPKPDNLYLDNLNDHPAAKNLVPNADLKAAKANATTPLGWATFADGTNQAQFQYHQEAGMPYVETAMRSYRDGEAKWQYPPVTVTGSQRLAWGITYRATAPADIVAEYTLANGQRQFATLATVNPSEEWTQYKAYLETPPTATGVFVSLVLRHEGTVAGTAYQLSDASKRGAAQFQRPLVSVTFDDGWESAYTAGASVLDEFGFRGTYYLNSSVIGTRNFVKTQQLQDLQQRGHELAAHGYDHVDMTTLNDRERNFQLASSQRFIRQQTGRQTVDYASPYGKSDAEVQATARQYFSSLRGTISGINTRQNFDPYAIRVLYIGNKTSLQEISEAIHEAVVNHAWLVFTYHRIENPTPQTAASNVVISPAIFQQQMQLIKKANLSVVTVDQALRELRPQVAP